MEEFFELVSIIEEPNVVEKTNMLLKNAQSLLYKWQDAPYDDPRATIDTQMLMAYRSTLKKAYPKECKDLQIVEETFGSRSEVHSTVKGKETPALEDYDRDAWNCPERWILMEDAMPISQYDAAKDGFPIPFETNLQQPADAPT